MRCFSCGKGEYKEIVFENYFITDPFYGKYVVKDVRLNRCTACGDTLWDSKPAQKKEEALERIKKTLLLEMPVSAFVPAKEAAKILGMSIPAFTRNPKVLHKVFWIKRFGIKLYLERSLLLFAKTGDGRFYIGKGE